MANVAEQNKHKKKQNAVFIIILIMIVVGILLNGYANDAFKLAVSPEDYKLTDEAGGIFPEDAENIEMSADNEFRGNLLESKLMHFERGTYQFSVSCLSDGGNYIELFSNLYPGSENQPYKQFEMIPCVSGETSFSVTFDHAVRGAQLRVIYGGGNFQLYETKVTGRVFYYMDSIFVALCLVCGVLLLRLFIRRRKATQTNSGMGSEPAFSLSKDYAVIICLLVAVAATLPMFREFLVPGHDLDFHLTRIEGIKEGLLAGQFPVRINPTSANGHGYASPTMYPELFLYIPALFRLCGVSMLVAYQTFCLLINISTAFLTYHCVSRLCKSTTVGIMASCLYTLSLYRMVNLYTRAALGEFIAMTFLPCVIYGMYEVFFGENKEKQYKWLVIGMTGIIQSHIITTQVAVIFCTAFACACARRLFKDRSRLITLLKSMAVTLALNLWFLVPFITLSQKDLIAFSDKSEIYDFALYPTQMFATFVSAFGWAPRIAETAGKMPVSVGGILGAGIIIYLGGKLFHEDPLIKDGVNLDKTGRAGLLFAAFSLYISSVYFPWKTVREIPFAGTFLNSIQYPWRYLMVASVFLSIVFAIGIYRITKPRNHNKTVLLVLVAAIFAISPYVDHFVQQGGSPSLADKFDSLDTNLYCDQYFEVDTDIGALIDGSHAIETASDIEITNYEKKYTNIRFDYTARSGGSGMVTLPLYHYPGYQARLNGSTLLKITRGDNNRLAIMLPEDAGGGSVSVSYKGLWYFRLADIFSALFLLAVVACYFWRKKKEELPCRASRKAS